MINFHTSTSPTVRAAQFPVVCIGMSAGAIEPLQTFFRTLNPHTGMAFVVIHHLRQEHPTRCRRSCRGVPLCPFNWPHLGFRYSPIKSMSSLQGKSYEDDANLSPRGERSERHLTAKDLCPRVLNPALVILPPSAPVTDSEPPSEILRQYYYDSRDIRECMSGFQTSAAYIAATSERSEYTQPRSLDVLPKYLENGMEIDRPLLDGESLIVDIELEYVNLDRQILIYVSFASTGFKDKSSRPQPDK